MMKDFKSIKVDIKEVAESLKKISEEDRLKVYYMIKGIELVSESSKQPA